MHEHDFYRPKIGTLPVPVRGRVSFVLFLNMQKKHTATARVIVFSSLRPARSGSGSGSGSATRCQYHRLTGKFFSTDNIYTHVSATNCGSGSGSGMGGPRKERKLPASLKIKKILSHAKTNPEFSHPTYKYQEINQDSHLRRAKNLTYRYRYE
jgi:hypothetical protein